MVNLRSLVLLLAALAATPTVAVADGGNDDPYCLTTPHLGEVIVARDAAQMRRLAHQLGVSATHAKALAADVNVTREGEIVVLEADETLVTRNMFDLSGKAIRFMRRRSGFAVGRERPGFARPVGKPVDLVASRSVWVDFDHGATFPFGDEVHTGMWINRFGSLSFQRPDSRPPWPLYRMMDRQPRIAPLTNRYDLQEVQGAGGIYYWVDRETLEIRVTWLRVPVIPSGELASFQVRLRPDGRITFAYGRVDIDRGVVGVFPASAAGTAVDLRVLDLDRELPAPAASGIIAEEYTDIPTLNHSGFSRAFFEHFEDRYDFISIWVDFDIAERWFFHAPVRQDIEGTGAPIVDDGEDWGSGPDGQLKAYLFMNSLNAIPDDPDENFVERPASVTEILGHEVGHRWLSFTRFRDPRNGETSDALLGRQRAHWSFNMDTDASIMEGNDIVDNGDGTFTTVDTYAGYSDLDLYLMGFIPPWVVPPFFFVDGPHNPWREDRPLAGVDLAGERVDVALDDIVAVEGQRVPDAAAAQKDFRMAFILVTLPGEAPREGSLAKLDAYRQRWETWWAEATLSEGTFDTTLEDPRP
jgi:hypothetical protein